MSSCVHPHNQKKDFLIYGEDPMEGLNGLTLTAEKKY